MRIVSYNVNGIRSAISKGFFEWLENDSPDVLCLQETKAQPDQIDTMTFQSLGYTHSILNSAQKKGYSGVGIFSKTPPDFFSIGMGDERFDHEGRVIRADFGDVTVVCVYIPSGTMGDVRQAVKMEFLEAFTNYLLELKKQREHLVVCGDFNICHKPIDINHPERHTKSSGFLPEEREWFDQLIGHRFVDSFRHFSQEPEQYSWWSFRSNAKVKNLGWRIDYHIVTEELKERLKQAAIHPDISFSDHCPVSIELH